MLNLNEVVQELTEAVRGFVRPSVTISLTVLIIYLAIIGKIEPREVVALYGPVLGFWFGQRVATQGKQ